MSFMNIKHILKENFFKDFAKTFKQIRKVQKVKSLARKNKQAKIELEKMQRNIDKINQLGANFEKNFEKVFGKKPKISNQNVTLKDFF